MRMSTLLEEVRKFSVDEGFSSKEIKMAIGIASDPRYAKGNMTGAVTAIEKMKKGLSKHPQVMAVLKRQNEDIDEAVSPAQQAAIAISKKERGEKPKNSKEEGNAFGKELKAARDKGEKTFVVSGKKYNVEDYDVKKDLDEAKFSDGMIDKLRKAYEPLRGKKIPPGPLMKIFDKIDANKDGLEQLYKANIPFVSVMAMSRLMLRHNYKATDINKLGKINMEEFESDLDENKVGVGLDEAMYHHVLKNKVVASGSKSDMMKLVKKNGATIHKGPDSNYVLNSPGAKVGDIKEETLDEAVEDIFIKKGDVNQIAIRVARTARSLGLKAALKDGTVRIMGPKKKVSDFMRITIGKTSSGDASTVGKVSSQDDKLLDIQLTKEEVNEMAYKPGKMKDTKPQESGAKAFDKLIQSGGLDKKDYQKARQLYVQASDAASREKLKKFIYNLDTEPTEAIMDLIGKNDPDTFNKMYPKSKPGEYLSSISYNHRNVKAEEVELGEKYDLYHKDFSSAMQHAYSYAKSKMGITVDPKEIDSKVATGPKKPSEGKTNTYKLKGKGGNLQIQVYNKGGSKPFELNMYKEENQLISLASKHISHIQMTERKVDPADVDDNASEKDVEDAGKNIIMQLRKSVSMRGNKDVEFASGKQKVDMKIAQKALDMYNKMKPQDKTKFQTTIAKSYKDLLNAIKGN